MKYLKLLLLLILLAVASLVGLIVYATITWYNPPAQLELARSSVPDTIRCDTVLSVISWNIGFAGLGDDMDFFYDGGKEVRSSKERTILNMDSISHFLGGHRKASFILLQEVDLDSKRSYYINQKDILDNHLGLSSVLAPNYVADFVPVPPLSPMGKVNSGIWSAGSFQAISTTRYGYPGLFGWPSRLFNLRRCMLVNRYPTENGRQLVVINSHLSAFDDGSLKKQEMEFLRDFVSREYSGGNYVLVGGDWNQSPQGFLLTAFGANYQSESFILSNIADDFMPGEWKWAFDPKSPTNRYLNEVYTPGKTFRCLIDFFLVSPNIEVVSNKTYDLKFRNSDHNPIQMDFKLLP